MLGEAGCGKEEGIPGLAGPPFVVTPLQNTKCFLLSPPRGTLNTMWSLTRLDVKGHILYFLAK